MAWPFVGRKDVCATSLEGASELHNEPSLLSSHLVLSKEHDNLPDGSCVCVTLSVMPTAGPSGKSVHRLLLARHLRWLAALHLAPKVESRLISAGGRNEQFMMSDH